MNPLDLFAGLRSKVVRPARGFLKHPYVVPGGFYDELWDWDGFFIGLHFLHHGQPEYLRGWALNYLESAQKDGWVPGCLTPKGPAEGHRAFQMKPFLAQGVVACPDYKEWIEPYFPRLIAIVTRRERTHFDPKYGLFYWDDAMQSGADNNPAITNEPGLRGQVLACDINAYMIREYRILAEILIALGHDPHRFEVKANALIEAIENELWSEEDGCYWNVRRDTGAKIPCVNWSVATLLWIGAIQPKRAKSVVEGYLFNEEHLLSAYGVRSLSRQEPLYNNADIIWPHSNWQGPVWVIANWFAYCGLRQYGYLREASTITQRLTSACFPDLMAIGSMHENYDAETGQPLSPSAKNSPTGTEGGFISWNLLLQDMSEGMV